MDKFVNKKIIIAAYQKTLKIRNYKVQTKMYWSNIEINTNKHESNSFKIGQMIHRAIYRRGILQNQ